MRDDWRADPLTADLDWTEASPYPPGRLDVAKGDVPPVVVAECEAYEKLFGRWPYEIGWRVQLELVTEGMRLCAIDPYQEEWDRRLVTRLEMGSAFQDVIKKAESRAVDRWFNGPKS